MPWMSNPEQSAKHGFFRCDVYTGFSFLRKKVSKMRMGRL
jgi:hypothetical protein